MEFRKYPSIENSYRKGFAQAVRDAGEEAGAEWVVTEKIHGANFSFWTDGSNVACGKRTSLLETPDQIGTVTRDE